MTLPEAKHHLLTCDVLHGAEAERIGPIPSAMEDAELDAKAVDAASRLAARARSAVAGPSIR